MCFVVIIMYHYFYSMLSNLLLFSWLKQYLSFITFIYDVSISFEAAARRAPRSRLIVRLSASYANFALAPRAYFSDRLFLHIYICTFIYFHTFLYTAPRPVHQDRAHFQFQKSVPTNPYLPEVILNRTICLIASGRITMTLTKWSSSRCQVILRYWA